MKKYNKEMLEQLLLEEIMKPKTKIRKITSIFWSIIGWGIMLSFGLGVYRLLEWLITM